MDFLGRPLRPSYRATPRDTSSAAMWRDLNVAVLRIGAWMGPLTAGAYLLGFILTGHPVLVVMAGVSMLIGAASVVQLRRHTADTEGVLYIAAISVVIGGTMMSPLVRGGMWAAIAIIAMVGVLFLPRWKRRRFLATMSVLLLGQLLWPVLGLASPADTATNLVVSAAATAVGALAVLLTRAALEESDRTRLEIFRRVPVGLFRTSPDGTVIDANPALHEMLGYSPGSLAGTAIADANLSGEDWQALAAMLQNHLTPQRFAHRMRTASGAVIWVRGYAQAVRDDQGVVLHFEGSIEDVTQRREIEEASRINAERFRAVFELAPIAIWEEDFIAVAERLAELRATGVTDLRAHLARDRRETLRLISLVRYVDVNPAGAALISAASTGDALEHVVPDIPTPEILASFTEQFTAIWEDHDHLTLAVIGSAVDGRQLDLTLSWAAARKTDGSLDFGHVVVAITDVSAIRAAERELAALVDSKDELVASVSHELRTPITTILGMASELRDHAGEFSQTETREFISFIADQSRELANIVEDLLVAARSDDTLAVRPEVLDIHDEVVRMLASSPAGAHPDVRIHGRGLAWADPLRLRQIVRNLLTNARRYGGPHVTIEVGRAGVGISLRVKDDGPGIPDADRDVVFQPYTRSGGDSGLPGSIGLGLPVSRRLARLMGGDLTYRYEGGSIFELTLPGATQRAA